MQKRGIKVWLLRSLLLILGLLVLAAASAWLYVRASLAQLDGKVVNAALSGTVTVARDERGVPLISGGARDDVGYATGYVHAQERFFQMDLLRRVGAGELAELFGPRALPRDRSNRLHRFHSRAIEALKLMPPAERALLDRYVAGVNDGLNALSAHPFEYALVGVKPRAWVAADSLLVVYAMYFDLQSMQEPRELARGWLRDHSSAEQLAFLLPEASSWDAPIDADAIALAASPIPAQAPSWWGTKRSDSSTKVASVDFTDAVGSNNWAVAGSRSKDGGAIVSDDMHLGTNLPNIWYRVALQFPDAQGVTRRMAGVSLPGAAPLIVAGSNGRVAWGFTNSYADLVDLIAVGTDPARPGQVLTPSGWETPRAIEETILVKGAAAQKIIVRETSLGPLRGVNGRDYALHWVAHLPNAVNINLRHLESAATLDEALAIASTLGIPSQNLVGGDADGNIGWSIAGPLPKRSTFGSASSFPIGASDAGVTFDGQLAPADYPRLVNPPGGQLATANSRTLAGPGFALLGDGGYDIGARARQVRESLSALGPKTDVAGVYGVALDDRALFIAPWRERLLKVLDAAALDKQPLRAEFRNLLENSWSGRASIESVGYRLARHTMWALGDMMFDGANGQLALLDAKATVAMASSRWPAQMARLLDEQPAGWLPPGFKDWRAVQLHAVDQVIADLTKDGQKLSAATWGTRNSAKIAHPISMAVPLLAPLLSAPQDQLPGDANMPRVAGPNFGQSERLTVTPGKEEQGVFNMPGGQSGHPLSPFFLNGHQDWVSGKPTPLLPGVARHTLTFSPR